MRHGREKRLREEGLCAVFSLNFILRTPNDFRQMDNIHTCVCICTYTELAKDAATVLDH